MLMKYTKESNFKHKIEFRSLFLVLSSFFFIMKDFCIFSCLTTNVYPEMVWFAIRRDHVVFNRSDLSDTFFSHHFCLLDSYSAREPP
jgi:hypothetical protein